MLIYKDETIVSLSEFQKKFPFQAKIYPDINLETLNISREDISFQMAQNKIELCYKSFSPLSFELDKKLKYHRHYFYKNSIYKDPLARALGYKQGKEKPNILDATGGALSDSMLILSYGVNSLQVIERSPIVAILGSNALDNLNSELVKFHYGNVQDIKLQEYDVAYYDPMYEQKNTKTSPKKEMSIFRDIVKADLDTVEVAKFLQINCQERLVIKRSRKAEPLLEKPSYSIKGKSTCYDVYIRS